MKFSQKDELGLERIYYVITQIELDNEEFYVYTDLVNEDEDKYRIFIGQAVNGKIERINKDREKIIIKFFRTLEEYNEKELVEVYKNEI